jgi:P27 family predicted phage terminase small subunit
MAKKRWEYKLPEIIRQEKTEQVIKDIVEELRSRDALTPFIAPMLDKLAVAYDRWWTLELDIRKEGETQINAKQEEVTRPQVNIAHKLWTQYEAVSKEFGLTPKSLQKIKPKDDSKGKVKSPIEKYL